MKKRMCFLGSRLEQQHCQSRRLRGLSPEFGELHPSNGRNLNNHGDLRDVKVGYICKMSGPLEAPEFRLGHIRRIKELPKCTDLPRPEVLQKPKSICRQQGANSGDRPYKCRFCSYSSKRKDVLVVHERKHTGENPFACMLCPYAAKQRAHLDRHKRKEHGRL